MKKVGWFFLVLVGIIGGGYYLLHQFISHGNAGYLIFGFDRWVVETSLLVGLIVLLLFILLVYLALRLFSKAVEIPRRMKSREAQSRAKRADDALLTGLIQTAEGQWESAERQLIRHAADSGVPLINYLTAARAAHARGAPDLRDEYLKLAGDSRPDARIAIGLTRAELQLSNKQFDEAIEGLLDLQRIAPSHATVLRMMHHAYVQMQNWEGLQKLIPALNQHKVLIENEIRALEAETYSALIKQKAQTRDAGALRELWRNVPSRLRDTPAIESLYFAAMIEANAGLEVEESLRRALARDWNPTLLVLYECVPAQDAAQQLAHAQTWLPMHPNDALLLRVLGKLALRARQPEQAAEYFRQSVALEPSADAYKSMGDLLIRQSDFRGACDYYRRGLMFLAGEAVAQIETLTDTDLAEPPAAFNPTEGLTNATPPV